MKVYLSRQYDGSYIITKLKPVRLKMPGTDHDCLYPAFGETVNLELCEEDPTTFGYELDLFESKYVTVEKSDD